LIAIDVHGVLPKGATGRDPSVAYQEPRGAQTILIGNDQAGSQYSVERTIIPAGARSVNFADLTKDIRVMAPLGDQMHRGIVVEPPADHPWRTGMICVKFTPPVKATEADTVVTYVTCDVERVELGWPDDC
jgi:hypothetical protein